MRGRLLIMRAIFQSTLPGWGATPVRQRARMHHFISIHAPRMGSDFGGVGVDEPFAVISIHAPRMGSDGRADGVAGLGLISIHAPRMGSDRNRPPASAGRGDFNPRSPDGERHQGRAMTASEGKFQSTLPGWGATVDAADRLLVAGISIHAPRMGSDLSDTTCHALRFLFQSTLPGWGATRRSLLISSVKAYFNPRSPDGERLILLRSRLRSFNFNPRSPDGERPRHCAR